MEMIVGLPIFGLASTRLTSPFTPVIAAFEPPHLQGIDVAHKAAESRLSVRIWWEVEEVA